jgi:hypothetical protein
MTATGKVRQYDKERWKTVNEKGTNVCTPTIKGEITAYDTYSRGDYIRNDEGTRYYIYTCYSQVRGLIQMTDIFGGPASGFKVVVSSSSHARGQRGKICLGYKNMPPQTG